MSIERQHDLHKRRFSRNLGLGLVLAAFVVLVFGFPPPNSRSSSFWVLAAPAEEGDGDMIQRR